MIIATEIVVASIAVFVFGLLLILVALRLRSRESVIFHLALYIVLGLGLSISNLLSLLAQTTSGNSSTPSPITEFLSVAMVLSFGALTLNFLKKERKVLYSIQRRLWRTIKQTGLSVCFTT